MPYDSEKYDRKSIRLKEYDYSSAGWYFVTICAQKRECVFGHVSKGDVILNRIGQIVMECWKWLPQQYQYVNLDEWVIMPNHLHGIIIINNDRGMGGSRTAPTTKIKPLGALIGAFKTVSTKRIRQEYDCSEASFWQRNYYEHVIRNDADLLRIREYIINNPVNWETDEENHEKPARPAGSI